MTRPPDAALALALILTLGLLCAPGATARSGPPTAIPLVVIDAPHGIVDEPKRRAKMKVIDRNRRGIRSTNYAGSIGIELRGLSSLKDPKKSYSLETRTRSGRNRNVSLLGMPKDEDWILLANQSDRSLLRDEVAFSASRWLGRYASRTRLVEVVVNRRYRGVYGLTERLKLHKRRVTVDGRSTKGGYLLELANSVKAKGERFFHTPLKQALVVYTDPDGKDLSSTRADAIRDYVGQFERVLYGPGFTDPQFGYQRYLDVDAAVDYVLLNELFKNHDTFSGSTFVHKGVGGRLVLGPVWDLDDTMGNRGGGDRVDSVEGWRLTSRPWVERLYADPAFDARLAHRWSALRHGLLRHITRTIDRGVRQLRVAQARNFRRWRILGVDFHYNVVDPRTGAVPKTYAEEVDYLKWWIRTRASWIDSQLRSVPG